MGVLLYADDDVFSQDKPEFRLFQILAEDKPVLGVSAIEQVENSVKSIGSFDAIILDWDFGENKELDISEELDGVKVAKPSTKEDETFLFLQDNYLHCLIYIFSENDIENGAYGEKLKARFGSRIKFLQKENFGDEESVQAAKTQILTEISEWNDNNQGLALPIKWGQSINQSLQKVFAELAEADESWIKEIYNTVNTDGLDGKVFLVELLQMILSEQILTDTTLLKKIEDVVGTIQSTGDEQSIAKLFSRLYYSKLGEKSPIMTGDICQIDKGTFGVIVTPECDIRSVLANDDLYFDVLTFTHDSFNNAVQNNYDDYTREIYNKWKGGNVKAQKKVDNLRKLFNQNEPKIHYLPSFPLFSGDLKNAGLIDFSKNTVRLSTGDASNSRQYKLNSPFIQQLRQRYLSYVGRVGVPALPSALKDWNLG